MIIISVLQILIIGHLGNTGSFTENNDTLPLNWILLKPLYRSEYGLWSVYLWQMAYLIVLCFYCQAIFFRSYVQERIILRQKNLQENYILS